MTLFCAPRSRIIPAYTVKKRDFHLDVFALVEETRVLAENWRLEYNDHQPRSSLGYKMLAQFAAACIASVSATS
jgi:hypothetical protein